MNLACIWILRITIPDLVARPNLAWARLWHGSHVRVRIVEGYGAAAARRRRGHGSEGSNSGRGRGRRLLAGGNFCSRRRRL